MLLVRLVIKRTLLAIFFIFFGYIVILSIYVLIFPKIDDNIIISILLIYMLIIIVKAFKPNIFNFQINRSKSNKHSLSENYSTINEIAQSTTGQNSLNKQELSVKNLEIDQDWDTNTILSKLEREEKFILMIGLVALYGDEEFSMQEISKLREIISKIDFSPSSLIHRDPYDEELCLDEKVAWSLDLIRNDFTNSNEMTEKNIFELFKSLTALVEKDLKAEISDKVDRQEYSNRLKQALIDIAEADGILSKKERKIINIFVSSSKFQASKVQTLISYIALAGLLYLLYGLIVFIFERSF